MTRPVRRFALIAALARYWADDRGLSVFSALLFVTAFVLPPFLPRGSGRSLAGDFVYSLLLISGVAALGEHRKVRMLLMPVAAAAIAVDLASRVLPVPEPLVIGMGLLSLALLLVVVLALTLRSGPITLHRVQGGISAYVLLGILWAYAYSLVELLRPGAFSGALSPEDGPRAFLYFSFVTLTTVGYGDVLPVHPAARSLAILEAVTGPLYLAILLARLVSLAVIPATRAASTGKGRS